MSTVLMPFSCAMAISRWVTGSLAWTRTSPVAVSTMLEAANAPSSSWSSMRTASISALRRAVTAEWVILRPLWISGPPLSSWMSTPARSPTRLSATLQKIAPSRRLRRSTAKKARMISSLVCRPRARRKTVA